LARPPQARSGTPVSKLTRPHTIDQPPLNWPDAVFDLPGSTRLKQAACTSDNRVRRRTVTERQRRTLRTLTAPICPCLLRAAFANPAEWQPRRAVMWRMNSGDRVLSDAEWNLFRVGLGDLWDSIEDDCVEDGGLSQTGVRVFDSLQPEQKIALL